MNPIIAIDVALLPPEEVIAKAKKVNGQLWEQTRKGFRFDETHLPHITLVQMFVNESDLPAVQETIDLLIPKLPSPIVTVAHINLYYGEPPLIISGWDIENDPALPRLHSSLLSALEAFSTAGSDRSYLLDSGETVREGVLEYTRTFRDQHSMDKYVPHITLGVGTTPEINKPFSFTITRLAVCQLGNFGTWPENPPRVGTTVNAPGHLRHGRHDHP